MRESKQPAQDKESSGADKFDKSESGKPLAQQLPSGSDQGFVYYED